MNSMQTRARIQVQVPKSSSISFHHHTTTTSSSTSTPSSTLNIKTHNEQQHYPPLTSHSQQLTSPSNSTTSSSNHTTNNNTKHNNSIFQSSMKRSYITSEELGTNNLFKVHKFSKNGNNNQNNNMNDNNSNNDLDNLEEISGLEFNDFLLSIKSSTPVPEILLEKKTKKKKKINKKKLDSSIFGKLGDDDYKKNEMVMNQLKNLLDNEKSNELLVNLLQKLVNDNAENTNMENNNTEKEIVKLLLTTVNDNGENLLQNLIPIILQQNNLEKATSLNGNNNNDNINTIKIDINGNNNDNNNHNASPKIETVNKENKFKRYNSETNLLNLNNSGDSNSENNNLLNLLLNHFGMNNEENEERVLLDDDGDPFSSSSKNNSPSNEIFNNVNIYYSIQKAMIFKLNNIVLNNNNEYYNKKKEWMSKYLNFKLSFLEQLNPLTNNNTIKEEDEKNKEFINKEEFILGKCNEFILKRVSSGKELIKVQEIMGDAFNSETDNNSKELSSFLRDSMIIEKSYEQHFKERNDLIILTIEELQLSNNNQLKDNNNFVATAEMILGKHVASIHNVGTRKNYQRKGYATYLMIALMEIAKSKGYDKIVLEATDSGKFVYLKLGFEELFDYLSFVTFNNSVIK
ncbi:hypothetical protein ABK040_011796 [Willaertia magna]